MNTIMEKAEESEVQWLKRAGEIIKKGGLVAFPTETVYGLGGDALDAEASAKIYAAKGRPSDNPLIVHIAQFDDIYKIASKVPKEAKLLADKFWPGPLTMILNKTKAVPHGTTGGLDTVAVRMPSHPVALAFIKEAGGYIAAPSANTSGRPSPTKASHVWEDLHGKIDMIIDGGKVGIGLESTIVDLTGEVPVILRPGYINQDMLKEVLAGVQMDNGLLMEQNPKMHPKAPGMKYKHYAPKADLVLVSGQQENVTKKINELSAEQSRAGKHVGIIAADETAAQYPYGTVKDIGCRKNEETIAHNLYEVLRQFDEEEIDCIYSETFMTPKMGDAIMNRLLKAAGHQVIDADAGA